MSVSFERNIINFIKWVLNVFLLVSVLTSTAQSNLIREEYRNVLDCDTPFFTTESGKMLPCDSCPTASLKHSNVNYRISYHRKDRGNYVILYPLQPEGLVYNSVIAELCKVTDITPNYSLQFRIENNKYTKRIQKRAKIAILLSDTVIAAQITPDSHWKFIKLMKYREGNGWYTIPLYSKSSVSHVGIRFSQKWGYNSFVIDDLFVGAESDKGCNTTLGSTIETCNLISCTREKQIILDSTGLSKAVKKEISTLIKNMRQYSFQEIYIDCIGDTSVFDSLAIGERLAFETMYFIRDSKGICIDKWDVQGTNSKVARNNITGSPRLIIRFRYRNKE